MRRRRPLRRRQRRHRQTSLLIRFRQTRNLHELNGKLAHIRAARNVHKPFEKNFVPTACFSQRRTVPSCCSTTLRTSLSFGVVTNDTLEQQKADRAKRFGLPTGGAAAAAATSTSSTSKIVDDVAKDADKLKVISGRYSTRKNAQKTSYNMFSIRAQKVACRTLWWRCKSAIERRAGSRSG
jgi:hypothetical protein